MIFLITLVLGYSMTKSVVIILIYFLIFLWDLFAMGLILSGEDLIKTAEGHMRSTCRKVNSQARCPAQYSLSRKLTCNLDSRLALVLSDLRSSPVLLKIVTFCIPISYTIYTLITHINGKELIERKKPRRGFYNTPTLLKRELLILREKSLQSLLLPSLIVISVERRFVPKYNLLGSKTLGIKCIRTSMYNVLANHDQNLESRFRLLKVSLFVKLESSELQDLLAKSARLDRLKIRLDRLNLVQINFLQMFPTQAKPGLTCRVLYFTPSIKGKTLAVF